ncbi:MAG TPA: phosphatidylglycerol lysyltransferase domain-containing protein, partial [Gaiellaceae bacterium]|nr:phosphatidylglycerol lysyltransferase domain-containing protein [Gaiellaceae bacterium]
MVRAMRFAHLAAGGVLAFIVVLSSQGWLYELRSATLAGPRIRDALPLDELPRHDSVSLLLFVTVWGAAGVAVGLLARRTRIERLTAALLAALATGLWLFATTWASLVIVRQVANRQAFHAAIHVPALYLAAGLIGLGCAVFARSGAKPSGRAPLILAALVAAAGILDIASAATPELTERVQMVEAIAPNVVPGLASALIVPTGVALIVLARGLRRRRRRAWQLTVALILVAAVLHILKGLDYEEATVSIALALALVARRHDFERGGDPATRAEIAVRAALYTLAIFAYGTAALWVNRIEVDRPYSLGFALRETASALAGLHPRGSGHLSGRFGEWFPNSVFLLGVAGFIWLLATWLAPWRYRCRRREHEHELVRELVRRHGFDTLAPFVLRPDKSYFFTSDERACLAYRVIAGVAVVSGDPIGPPGAVDALIPAFLRFARERDWRVAVLGAGEGSLRLYAQHGLRALYHGDEGVIDVASFSLEGRPIRKVRQSVNRLERAGYTAHCVYAGDVDPALAVQLAAVADEWRGSQPQRGFTMEFGSLFDVGGREALFVVGRDVAGDVAGFFHLAVSPAS